VTLSARESARDPTVATGGHRAVHPSSAPAHRILRCYFDDIVGRYYGRQATDDETDSAMRDDPSHDLAPPMGLFLVAREHGEAVGCAGLRLLPDGIAERKRLFVVSSVREAGLGVRLMKEIEVHARRLGVREMRLSARRDLIEAQRLYARLGYEQTTPFNNELYADLWFCKRLF
jgi:GNAT superfamily N-acetyltransferase